MLLDLTCSFGDTKMSTVLGLVNRPHKFLLFLNSHVGLAIVPRIVIDDLHTLDLV